MYHRDISHEMTANTFNVIYIRFTVYSKHFFLFRLDRYIRDEMIQFSYLIYINLRQTDDVFLVFMILLNIIIIYKYTTGWLETDFKAEVNLKFTLKNIPAKYVRDVFDYM